MNTKTNQLLQLLLKKHSQDLCVPECKTGSSWFHNVQILDLWAMRRSWANFRTYGYEIKISRSDFLNDNKWQGYLKYCSDFYFVIPPNVISIGELPQDVGLLVSSQNLTRLYMKRKAVSRKVEMPLSLFKYILMWRTQIINQRTRSKATYWQQWIKERDEKKELGYNVSKKIADIMEKRIRNVEIENHRLEAENKSLTNIKQVLEILGININEIHFWNIEDRIKKRIKEIETGIPEGLLNYINGAIINLQGAKEKMLK